MYVICDEEFYFLHLDSSLSIGLGSGLLVGVPIPSEHAIPNILIDTAIQQALQEAR